MFKNLLIFIFLSFCIYQALSIELDPNEENVCSFSIDPMTLALRKQNCQINQDNFPYSICMRHLEIESNQKMYKCCDGYHQVDNKCEKSYICQKNCLHGHCNAGENNTETCDCILNFGGINCDQQCPENTFGLNCENDCKFITNPKLNKNYKHCSCNSDTVLTECKDICTCRKNLCPQGFIGKNCSVPCKEGKYGYGCTSDCKCFADGTLNCNNESGDCKCKDRFFGIHCENSCFTGDLICSSSNSTIDCRCELTLGQQIEKITSTKNDFMIALIILSLISLVILIGFIKYKIKSNKLKNNLKIMSVKYLNQHESNNQEASINLGNLIKLNDFTLNGKENSPADWSL